MKISKQELINLHACERGIERFIEQTNNTDDLVDVAGLVGGLNNYSDLIWLASKKLPKERIIRFACDCALLNIEKIEQYTDNYEFIVEFLRNPSAHGARPAYAYAAAAYTAADAAEAAAFAYAYDSYARRSASAYSAVYAARVARSAARVARASSAGAALTIDATDAAYAADDSANDAADTVDGRNEVNKLLIAMFNEYE